MESLGSMTTSIRPNPRKPCASVPQRVQLRSQSQTNCVQVPVLAKQCPPLSSLCLPYSPLLKHRRVVPKSRYQQGSPVCLLGGKPSDNQGTSWNPFGQDMGNLGGKSIEEVLREQIEKKEYYNGGSGKKPPRGGGGGHGSGGSDDERIRGILDETLQVVLATAGFMFLYVCMISGQEMTKLANDYIKFLLRGTKSSRLKRAMNKWRKFAQILSRKEENDDHHWLESEITDNSTSFDSSEQYERILGEDFAASD